MKPAASRRPPHTARAQPRRARLAAAADAEGDFADGEPRPRRPLRAAARSRARAARSRLGPRVLRLPRRRAARHRPPQPLAAEPAEPDRRPLRDGPRLLPAARLRPLEHARGRGRDGHRRDRPADLAPSARRPRSPSTASTAASARSPGSSTPTATSTTSAAPKRARPARGGGARDAGARPGRLPPPRGQRERLRRHGDGPARRLHVRGDAASAGRDGQIGAGLGQTTSLGTVTLIPPNLEVTATGQEETVDGIRMVFQLTPGTEAPAEMNFLFPDRRVALHRRERDAHDAQHRSPSAAPWSATRTSGPTTSTRRSSSSARDCDVLFAGHHWPLLGQRADRRLPAQAARPLRLPARPDAAPDQPGPHRAPRSPRMVELPPSLAARVALPRLLRLGQPQRQGGLPALPGLVRRQPGPPLAAPAGRVGARATSSSWAAPRRCWRGRASRSRPATTAG